MIDLEQKRSRRTFIKEAAFATAGALSLAYLPQKDTPAVLAAEVPAEGEFFTQTSQEKDKGFAVFNDATAPMWDTYNQVGGLRSWGYPLSNRFVDGDGRVCQTFQKGTIELSVDHQGKVQKVDFMDTMDLLEAKKVKIDPGDYIPKIEDWTKEDALPTGQTFLDMTTNDLA